MCVPWKNTPIRILNELWVEKWGAAEQTRVPLVGNIAIQCQCTLDIKSQIQVLWKPVSFVIHKVATTTDEEWPLESHPRKITSRGLKQQSLLRDNRERLRAPQTKGIFPKEFELAARCFGFLKNKTKQIETGWGKPFPVGRRDQAPPSLTCPPYCLGRLCFLLFL